MLLVRAKPLVQKWGHFLPLALGMLALIVMWLYYPHVYVIADPGQYARHAHLIATRSYLRTIAQPNIFGHRFGVFVPVGLVYALFGMSPHTTDLVPLLAGLIILFVVWRVLPPAAALLAVISVATCVPLLRGTTELWPDLISTAFLALSVLALASRLDASERPWRKMLQGALGVLAWFASMLAKESAWWALPLWGGALLVDALRGRRYTLKYFHLPALLFGLLAASGYAWFCGHFFGDALARLHTVAATEGHHFWSTRGDAALHVRLTSGAARFFWNEYGVLLVAAALGLPLLPPKLRIWGFYTVLTVLLFWFGSTSLKSYQPLPLIWRMSLPCAPGFCIAAAYFPYWLSLRLPRVGWQRLSLLVISALAIFALLPKLIFYVHSWGRSDDNQAMALLASELRQHPETQYLIVSAERRGKELVLLSLGLSLPANATVLYAGDVDTAALEQADTALLIVDPRLQLIDTNKSYAREFRALHLPTLFQQGDVSLFLASDTASIQALSVHPPAQRVRPRKPKPR